MPDLALLEEAAREAGEVALRFTGAAPNKTWDKPDGLGPVTEADLAVNTVLEDRLRGARPDYGWLSEESEDSTDRLSRRHTFIIDPIDGTRSFIEGSGTWAHSIAVVDEGTTVAAVVYLPKRDLLFSAAKGQGATLNGRQIRPSSRYMLDGAAVLAARPGFDAQHWQGGAPPQVNRAHRPSLAYRLATVAQGKFDAMFTLRPSWEWDVAAGDLILRESGAITSDRAGQPLRFNNPHPQVDGVVAANPALHAALRDALIY